MSIKDNIRDPDGLSVQLDQTFNHMDRPQSLWPGGHLPYSNYQKAPRPIATGYEIPFNNPSQPKSFEDQVADEVLKRLP